MSNTWFIAHWRETSETFKCYAFLNPRQSNPQDSRDIIKVGTKLLYKPGHSIPDFLLEKSLEREALRNVYVLHVDY